MAYCVNRFILLVIICSGAVLFSSCFKQEAPKVELKNTTSGRFDLRACEEVSILNDALKAANVINLFKCLGWNKELPHLYQVLNKTKKNEWDFLTSPIEDYFFDNRQRRDRLLEQLFLLSSRGGLSSISNIVNAAIDSNIIGTSSNLFMCADGVSSCRNTKIEKENIINVIKKINLEKSTYKQLENLIGNFIEDFRSNPQLLSVFYNDLMAGSNKDLVVLLVDTFLDQSINNQLTEQDSKFIFQILNIVANGESDPWIYNWIKKTDDKGLIKRFFDLVFIEKKEQFNDIQNLNLSKGDDLSCGSIDSNGREIEINIKQTINTVLNSLRTSTYNNFIKKMIFQVNMVNTSQEFCPLLKKWPKTVIKIDNGEIKQELHNLNFLKYLRDHVEILESRNNWELFRFLANVSYNISSLTKRDNHNREFNSEVLFMLHALSRPHTLVGVELLKNSIINNPNFYQHLSFVLKQTRSSQYKILGHLGKKFIDDQIESKDLGILWKNITKTDQKLIFKILDTIFENNNGIIPILDFIKFLLSELKISGDEIFEPLFKKLDSSDLLYQSVKNIIYNLNEKNVLNDLKKIFSDEYLLKIIQIFSGGIKLINVNQDVERTQINLFEPGKQGPELVLVDSNEPREEATKDIACLKQVLSPEVGLYGLIKNPSEECKKVDQFSSVLLNSLADSAYNYHQIFFKTLYSKSDSHLFDRESLFSPDLIAMTVFNFKATDMALKKNVPSDGITSIVKELPTFLFEKNYYKKCDKCVGALKVFNESLSTIKELGRYNYQNFNNKFEIYRNQLLRVFSSDYRNLDEAMTVIKYIFTLLGQYADFLLQHKEQPPLIIDQKFNCRNWMNLKIGHDPCPTKDNIKKSATNIVGLILEDHNNDDRNALYYFLAAIHADYGVKIPYQSDSALPYRLSLIETIQMLFNLSNKWHIGKIDKKDYYINRWPIYYRNINEERNDPDIYKTMTTLDRIEVTIRDIQFDSNYLGAHYENTVSKALDYNYVVKKNKFLLNICTRLRFCFHFINKNEKRLVKNALSSYDGLLHANSLFGYGKYMQSLLSIFVASSLKKSQIDSYAQIRFGTRSVEIPKPPSLDDLQFHNGKIIYEIAKQGGLNHLARFVHSRIGEDKKSIDNFISLYNTKRIDYFLLKGYELNQLKQSVEKILLKSIQKNNSETSLLEDFVDFFYDLNESDQREIEGLVYNLAYLHTLIGPPSFVGTKLFKENRYYTEKVAQNNFAGNNLSKILEAGHMFLDKYPIIKKTFTPYRLMRLIKFIKTPVEFLVQNLSIAYTDQFYVTYYLLNATISLVNKLLFEDYNGVKGIELVLDVLSSSKIVSYSFKSVNEFFNLFDRIETLYSKNEIANIYSKIGNRISNIFSDKNFSLRKWMSYLHQSTFKDSCNNVNIYDCKENYHFDGPFKILLFLSQHPEDKFSTRFESASYYFLDRYSQQLEDYIDEILGLVKIKLGQENLTP